MRFNIYFKEIKKNNSKSNNFKIKLNKLALKKN